jgi:putative endonuclease
MKKTKKKDIGFIGEDLAINFLEKNGYEILERNYRCKYGEIDLIAQVENKLVFIEVKLKKVCRGILNMPWCKAIEAVDYSKQKKIIKSALNYIQENNIENLGIQFDVVGIELEAKNPPFITHLKNAFEPIESDFEE